jgi:hypothetical protein
MTAPPKHPAKFTPAILDALRVHCRDEAKRLGRRPELLDPFAGVGRIHQLEDVADTTGIELRPRWAAAHSRTRIGDATRLPSRWTGRFDIVATSPCYGNRFADHHNAQDGSTRRSYHHDYGDPLWSHPRDAGVAHFRQPAYKVLHEKAWRNVERVLRPATRTEPGGLFLLNVKNFHEQHRLVLVVEWHVAAAVSAGLAYVDGHSVAVNGMTYGENAEAREDHELVLAFRKTAR